MVIDIWFVLLEKDATTFQLAGYLLIKKTQGVTLDIVHSVYANC